MTAPLPSLPDAVFSVDIRAPRQRVWEEITRLGSVSDILFHTVPTDITGESETVVTWELTEVDDGTRVTLTHSGFTDQTRTHDKVSGGWVTILDLLKVVAEGGRPPLKWKAIYWMMDRFGWMMPKSTRADEVLRAGG